MPPEPLSVENPGGGKGLFMLEWNLPILFLFVLASVGLVEVCTAITRWLCRSSVMRDSCLLVVVHGHDETVEGRLIQACGEVCLNRSFRGVRVAVVADSPDEETRELCRCCCISRGVPYIEDTALASLTHL